MEAGVGACGCDSHRISILRQWTLEVSCAFVVRVMRPAKAAKKDPSRIHRPLRMVVLIGGEEK